MGVTDERGGEEVSMFRRKPRTFDHYFLFPADVEYPHKTRYHVVYSDGSYDQGCAFLYVSEWSVMYAWVCERTGKIIATRNLHLDGENECLGRLLIANLQLAKKWKPAEKVEPDPVSASSPPPKKKRPPKKKPDVRKRKAVKK